VTPLKDALAAYSDWVGHGHGERAAAWLERLDLNRPELEAFRAAPDSASPAYVARPAIVAAADGDYAPDARLAADAPASLERAHAKKTLNAFIHIAPPNSGSDPDITRRDRGLTPNWRLAGVPVAVKDLRHVAGMPFTGGSRALDAETPTVDAEIVARLRRAGAVVMGLANLHELAYGVTSANPHFGAVVNPAAPQRTPGGSSGGSAAAIAAGIVRLAVGTDTAGSIRVPAACCGIVGFKPSYDALPRSGVLDLGASLDHVGPMAASVEDCATMFAAMLGRDSLPPWAYRDLRGRGGARLRGFFEEPLDGEVREALDAAQGALTADGASWGDRIVPGMDMAAAVQLNTLCAEAGAVHARRARDRGERLGEDVRVRIEMANFLPGHWYVKAQRMRTDIVARLEAAFGDADFLLCATLRCPAPAVGAARVDISGRSYALHTAVTQLTMPFNLAGLPAVSVPWGRSRDGVPIGLQVIARRGRDWQALAVAQRLQALSPAQARS
jgi:aspartyl-tRNA(Asn)/glutamyl-tRNA(Gln) amidotransferase subunit A